MRQALVEVLMWPPGFPSAQLAEVSHAQSLLVFFFTPKTNKQTNVEVTFCLFQQFCV